MDDRSTVQELKQKVRKFCEERNWDQFHNAKDLAIGIITEASELLEHFRFKNEQEVAALLKNPKTKKPVCEELVDVFHTVLRFAQKYEIDLASELEKKMKKNEKKHPLKQKLKKLALPVLFSALSVFQLNAEIVRKQAIVDGVEIVIFTENGEEVGQFHYKEGKEISRQGRIPDGLVQEYYPGGKLLSEKNYRNEKVQGAGLVYYETGKLRAQINYKDDQQDGLMKTFFEEGNTETEILFSQGKKEGPAKTYYSNGNKRMEASYKQDQPDGPVKTYFEDGQLQGASNFKQGVKDGSTKTYYPDGTLESKGNYEKGQYEGTVRWYFPNGKLWLEERYKAGKREGLAKKYFGDGKLEWKKTYKAGELVKTE